MLFNRLINLHLKYMLKQKRTINVNTGHRLSVLDKKVLTLEFSKMVLIYWTFVLFMVKKKYRFCTLVKKREFTRLCSCLHRSFCIHVLRPPRGTCGKIEKNWKYSLACKGKNTIYFRHAPAATSYYCLFDFRACRNSAGFFTMLLGCLIFIRWRVGMLVSRDLVGDTVIPLKKKKCLPQL